MISYTVRSRVNGRAYSIYWIAVQPYIIKCTKVYLSISEWKKNFLKIKKLVLVGGPDDGVITPWQSR